MSSLRGEPGSAWTLPDAVDTLAAAARASGRPSGIWIAGLGYQFLTLSWLFGPFFAQRVLQSALPIDLEWLGRGSGDMLLVPGVNLDLLSLILEQGPQMALVLAPVILISFRMVAGLARISPQRRWQEIRGERRAPRLYMAWHEGRGLTRPTLGLWVQVLLMMFGAALLFIGPTKLFVDAFGLDDWNPVKALIAGLTFAIILVYGFLLSILFQIALHSLVQNRRGVGSALLHAWRIAKNDPAATVRATALDAVLFLTIKLLEILIWIALGVTGLGWTDLGQVAGGFAIVGLSGFAGCTRCAYWARAYHALGGLSVVEDAPGA